ncbi:MAG: hypothetical protein HQK87_10685 [Nitrospinae bacterium]|nr:hypothetical protein [Nitrospinota bacterium]
MSGFAPRVLGRTGRLVGPLGVGASYGVSDRAVEEAFERGVRYFYWAWARRKGMATGLARLIPAHREELFITVTSLVPTAPMIRYSVERALRALGTDYLDALQFYLYSDGKGIGAGQLETALTLREEGKIRFIAGTGHQRPRFERFADAPFADLFHVRYNAIHRGAEAEVFDPLGRRHRADRPGLVAFTATSWRQLIEADPKRLSPDPVPTAGDCYRFALSRPEVDVCLTGPSSDEQMRHALDAVEKGPMNDDELVWMRRVGDRLKGEKQSG